MAFGLYFRSTMKTPLIYMMLAATCLVTGLSTGCSDGPRASQKAGPVQLGSTGPVELPAAWSIEPLAGPLSAGKTATVRVTAKIQDGWHVYSLTQPAGGPKATRIAVPGGQPFIPAGDPAPSVQPELKYDSAFRMNVQEHENAITFDVPVRATRRVAAPGDSIRIEVRYQVCDASLCYPQQTTRLAAAVTAGTGAAGE